MVRRAKMSNYRREQLNVFQLTKLNFVRHSKINNLHKMPHPTRKINFKTIQTGINFKISLIVTSITKNKIKITYSRY